MIARVSEDSESRKWNEGRGRTELTRRAREMVCWARVIVAVDGDL